MPERRRESRGKRILVVDDHAEVRGIVCGDLEQKGFVCAEAVDGADALAKAKEFNPDLVVLDLSLPAMNGYEVAMVLQRQMPQVPIVVFTMYGDTGRTLVKKFGVKAVVDKTEGITGLMECIREALREPPSRRQ